jgi:hypothetical protein
MARSGYVHPPPRREISPNPYFRESGEINSLRRKKIWISHGFAVSSYTATNDDRRWLADRQGFVR